MKLRSALIICGLLLSPLALLAQDVNRDFDKTFDFTKIKSFYMKIGTSWNNQLSEQRVKKEFAEALTEKGWKEMKAETGADMLVVLHGATDVKKSLSTFYDGWGGYGYGGWGGAGMSMGSSTTQVYEYTVGTLVVDMFPTASHNLVFRGTASDELNKNPEKNLKKIDKAATKMFKDFPPGTDKKK